MHLKSCVQLLGCTSLNWWVFICFAAKKLRNQKVMAEFRELGLSEEIFVFCGDFPGLVVVSAENFDCLIDEVKFRFRNDDDCGKLCYADIISFDFVRECICFAELKADRTLIGVAVLQGIIPLELGALPRLVELSLVEL